MTLTPATVRLDLKCGRGAISPGEKCTKGSATKVEQYKLPRAGHLNHRRLPKPAPKASAKDVVLIGVAGALLATSLYQSRNIRKAYESKFSPAQRFTPFTEDIGNVKQVLSNIKSNSSKVAAPSLFGDVAFGDYRGKSVAVKRMGNKGPMAAFQIQMMANQGMISAKTSDALIRAQNKLQVNEVQAAELAGKLGFGPKLVAAGDNTLITETAQGRPLVSQDRLQRYLQGQGQRELAADPPKFFRKVAGLQWRGLTKGTDISTANKARLIDNLARMHTAGIAHNDLHPGNVFISSKGAQFIDFGTSERGGGAVASEFVRLMNKPRAGLQQAGGMGYNLRTVNPEAYKRTESRLKLLIGKRVGSLTAADIQAAVQKSKDSKTLEVSLQRIIDDYYMSTARRDSYVYLDAQGRACGQSFIAAGQTCHKKGAIPKRAALAAGLTAGAIGGALLFKGSRNAVLGAPGALKRTAQRGVTEVVHRATAPKPSMRLTPGAFEGIKPPSKTQRLHREAQSANRSAEQAIKKAAQLEVERAGAVGEAMYKAGKATRASLRSGMRTHNLTVEKLRRRYEPGYRKGRKDNAITFYSPKRIQPPQRKDAIGGNGTKCGRSSISASSMRRRDALLTPANLALL